VLEISQKPAATLRSCRIEKILELLLHALSSSIG